MNLLSKIFGLNTTSPAKQIRQGFEKHFPDARNIEWTSHKKYHEAIFYEEDIEKIARFDNEGNLNETRINIAPADIPSWLGDKTSKELEIMNCISVLTKEGTAYELIVRDRDLNRYVMHVDTQKQCGAPIKL